MDTQKFLKAKYIVGVAALVLGSPLLLVACSDTPSASGAPAAAAPVEVEVRTITPATHTLSSELPGRIAPVRTAEVRARVAGIVQKRYFVEGATIKAGERLFTIEPAPFEAALARAEATLARAEAQIRQTQSVVTRYEPLVRANAVSQQEFDDALAALKMAQAAQLSAQAELKIARIDLAHATVRAPITGRIGRSLVSEGALVGQGEATPMALIQQMDPVYADFTQPVSVLLQLREAVREGRLSVNDKAQPRLRIHVDGARYTAEGHLLFSDITVDPEAGQVMLRGVFPNPQGILLPGMYVRVSSEQGVDEKAIFVPQRAVLRGLDGLPKVMVISAEGKAQERAVHTGVMQGAEWQITEGLQAGDRVIINGAEKLAPDTPVTAKTAHAPAQSKNNN